MTGILRSLAWIRCSNSMPLIPGSRTSVITRSIRLSSRTFNAPSARAAITKSTCSSASRGSSASTVRRKTSTSPPLSSTSRMVKILSVTGLMLIAFRWVLVSQLLGYHRRAAVLQQRMSGRHFTKGFDRIKMREEGRGKKERGGAESKGIAEIVTAEFYGNIISPPTFAG
ncbi:protein of unknown function [Nitrospira japonica]|uniref:Uncharacterized protein n=1 Tax=Nitrospira japonica TaxID=1325564 RepID=A0A1W1I2L8_9BACT|nr:protein of unknown function [Nitrospira japonica]